jgi:NAD(P)-dependent dehydrogenase (short-subunit alcohol dehydrogenase family)
MMSLAATFSLRGRTALITGSSRGIGRAMALALAEAGADVAIHGAGDETESRTVAALAESFGVRTETIDGDLTQDGAAKVLFETAAAALGRVDILVLNAAIQIPKDWTEIRPADTARQFAANYQSTLDLLQLAVPPMAERRWGRVLTIGSVQECQPHPDMLVYSSLKCAQTALGLSLAKRYVKRGVTVNNLAPGVIETDRYRARVTTPEQRERVLAGIPAGYIGHPTDCAGAALLLCSEAGRYITGQSLLVDGGMSLGA